MGYRRAKSTQGNTNFQKRILANNFGITTRGPQGSSELNTFPENAVILFCSNHHLSYADNGQQKIMWGIWMKYCTRVGVENGHSNEKIAENTALFFSSLAKSAMN